MGYNQPMSRCWSVVSAYSIVCALMSGVVSFGYNDQKDSAKEVEHLTHVDEQIEQFRKGEEFRGPVDAYLTDGQPDGKVLERLARALRREPEPVREQVARALTAIGRETDPLQAEGGNLIRNPAIVDILIKDGLSRPGVVRDYCFEVLQWSVPSQMLREHSARLIGNIEQNPDPTALLVLAKGKAPEAVRLVDSLMDQAEWAEQVETAIAKAALGDTELETEFVRQFLDTSDPDEKAGLAEQLGFIGTEATLRTLASEMRSDLVIKRPMVMMRSVRVDIVAALSYAFPDQTFLYDSAVLDDAGYERIEKFCEEKFGIDWEKPRPPFLWIQGFPSGTPK